MSTYVRGVTARVTAALNCKRGATAIEYGLIAAGIAVVVIAAVQLIGTNLGTTFASISSAL